MSIIAKFRVDRFESTLHQRQILPVVAGEPGRLETVEMRTIVLRPVYSDDLHSENRQFWNASPSGEIKLGTVNPAAWEYFELGKDYYIEFRAAE